jgi:hypothetical protein
MNVLASGILKAGEAFLHAGYCSAYPRTLDPHRFENAKPLLQLEVKEALRLEGETLVQAGGRAGADWTAPLGAPDPALAAIGPSHAWIALLAGTGLFFLVVALACRLRSRPQTAFQTFLAGVLALAVAVPLLFLPADAGRSRPAKKPRAGPRSEALARPAGQERASLPGRVTGLGGRVCRDPAPWKGVETKTYVHPDAATRVLLYGLIADGLTNMREPVKALSEIQKEIGFPNKDLSEGQAHALRTFGIDGWGTPFRFLSMRDLYTVSSAGPDRAFGTEDDISLKTAAVSSDDWDSHRWAFFIRKESGTTYVFYHRAFCDLFCFRDFQTAAILTDSAVFDVAFQGVPRSETAEFDSRWPMDKSAAIYDAVAGRAAYDPLVLHVIDAAKG